MESGVNSALNLDPNSAYAHEVLCWSDAGMGRIQDAKSECSRAVELDPLSVTYNWILSQVYWMSHESDRAIQQANKTLEIDPENSHAMATLGFATEQKGDHKKTVEQWIRYEHLKGRDARARRLKEVFDKSGYAAFVRETARSEEADGD